MTGNTQQVLSREEFLDKLGNEIPLSHGDIATIRSDWSSISGLAETLLPQMPDIGFFSNKKRRLAYLHLERKLEVMVIQEKISKNVKGLVLLLMEYSNSRFRKAANARKLVGWGILG